MPVLSKLYYSQAFVIGLSVGLVVAGAIYSLKHSKMVIQEQTTQETQLLRSQALPPLIKTANSNNALVQFNPSETAERKIYRICLTGGPCAGKTVGLAFLSEKMRERGFNVFIVPEAATIIGTGGGMLNMGSYSEDEIIKFQINLMKLQMSLEDTFFAISQINSGPKKAILLCDRGCMDGKAYMEDKVWDKMIKTNNLDECSLRERYDVVIHMVTAADGAEKFYSYNNNESRHEPINIALDLDKKSQEAWKKHPRQQIIDNRSVKTFQEKLEKLLNQVNNVVGLPMGGRTAKYLLDTDCSLYVSFPKEMNGQVQTFEIENIFLTTQKVSRELKIYQKLHKRTIESKLTYYYTQTNRENGIKTNTLRRQIDHTEFAMLLEHRDKTRTPAYKLRSCFQYKDVFMMVDSYPYVDCGFSILKVKEHEIASDFCFPNFLKPKRNVTDDPGYTMRNLAKRDWFAPTQDQFITHLRKLSNISDELIR